MICTCTYRGYLGYPGKGLVFTCRWCGGKLDLLLTGTNASDTVPTVPPDTDKE